MPDFIFNLPDLRGQRFDAHNEGSAALWAAFDANSHERVPIRLNTNPRMLMLDPKYNSRRISYEAYMRDGDVMAEAGLEWQYWNRFLLRTDAPRGLPDQWTVTLDFENHYDAAWFGCPIHYREWQVPDAEPILTDGQKRMLFNKGVPGPFEGEWAERALAFLESWQQKSTAGWEFLGRPVKPAMSAPFISNDGIFTTAAALRGPTGLCTDMLAEPEYVHELLAYVFEALTARMKAWREKLGLPTGPHDGFVWADDSIALLSTEQYREFVLPWHRRMYGAFATDKGRGLHLCGNVQRHLRFIKETLGISYFDTGFPIDFGKLRAELGPDVLISGGPPASLFTQNAPDVLVSEVERITRSGILDGGRFILQEGNNLPPRSSLEVCEAFYEAGKRLGGLTR